MKTSRKTLILAALAGLLTLWGGSVQAQGPDDLRVPAPEFPPDLKWVNSKPLSLSSLKGKVVLVDFWEYTCVNCIRTFPYLKAWHQKYADKGLVIIGVHTPEFQFAKEEPNVVKAAKEFGLAYPMVVDSDYAVWNTYGNRYWPAKYLIDKDGFVRYVHFGEGAYGQTEARIQQLLKEANPSVELPKLTEPVRGTDKPGAVCYPVTPELYLGSLRGEAAGTLANKEGYRPGKVVEYQDQGSAGWRDGMVHVSGAWMNTPEALISNRGTARDYIGIRYRALEVNAVMKPEQGKPVRVLVLHDGKPVAKKDKGTDIRYDEKGRSYLEVAEPKMYNILNNAAFAPGRTLKLSPQGAGLGIYSFTFTSCEVAKK